MGTSRGRRRPSWPAVRRLGGGLVRRAARTVRRHRVRRASRRPGRAGDPGGRRPASTCCSRSRWPSTSPDAERLADAVDEAGVSTLLFLTNRFTAEGREFVRRVAETEPQAAQVRFVGGGSLPGSFFATPWRVARGALLDLGPHVLDLLVAALGPVAEITATGDPTRVVALNTGTSPGSSARRCSRSPRQDAEDAMVCHVHTDSGPVVFDSRTVSDTRQVLSTIAARVLRVGPHGRPHALDVHRGVMLQRLLEQAERSLVTGRWLRRLRRQPSRNPVTGQLVRGFVTGLRPSSTSGRGHSQWLRLVAPSGPAR